MIEWLKTWSNQIIVASIIAIILEMVLPEGNNKKYIKMIIGIYVLFTIISPVMSKVTGSSLAIGDFDYNQYFDSSLITSSSAEEFEENNSKLIKQAYIDNIENDIKVKIKQKGYEVVDVKINIISDENSEKYGTITNITLEIDEVSNETQTTKNSNNIQIEGVEVKLEKNNEVNKEEKEEKQKETKTSEKVILSLKEYLSNEYSIDKEFININ